MSSGLVDVAALLSDRPGALAELGEALGLAGVSLEGDGMFGHDGLGLAHFLVDDAPTARRVAEAWSPDAPPPEATG